MVREPLVHRNDIPGETHASRRRNATSMVRPRHSADDAGAVRVVFARYAMGGRSQNRRQPSPEISRVVSQSRTFLQRRHGRRSKTLLERAEFFNVSASAGQCRNSNRPHGKTHGSALLRGIKSAKSSSGEECIRQSMEANKNPTTEVFAGLVERVTFHNEDNGFCVLRVKARGKREPITVVGHAAVISAGEFIQARGEWNNDGT